MVIESEPVSIRGILSPSDPTWQKSRMISNN
jgi:hypothetical protein